MIKTDVREELTCRIRQIPRLLKQAKVNLANIPLFYQETAVKMTDAIIDYLKHQFNLSLKKNRGRLELIRLSRSVVKALEDFRKFLTLKSAPIVIFKSFSKISVRNLFVNVVFPTPPAPNIHNL